MAELLGIIKDNTIINVAVQYTYFYDGENKVEILNPIVYDLPADTNLIVVTNKLPLTKNIKELRKIISNQIK